MTHIKTAKTKFECIQKGNGRTVFPDLASPETQDAPP